MVYTRDTGSGPDSHTNGHLVMSTTTTDTVTLVSSLNFFVLDLVITLYTLLYMCMYVYVHVGLITLSLSHLNMYMDFIYMFQFRSSQFSIQAGIPYAFC